MYSCIVAGILDSPFHSYINSSASGKSPPQAEPELAPGISDRKWRNLPKLTSGKLQAWVVFSSSELQTPKLQATVKCLLGFLCFCTYEDDWDILSSPPVSSLLIKLGLNIKDRNKSAYRPTHLTSATYRGRAKVLRQVTPAKSSHNPSAIPAIYSMVLNSFWSVCFQISISYS